MVFRLHRLSLLMTVRYALGVVALAIVYYGFGLVGLSLYGLHATALIWFPTAVGLAIVLLYGLRYWPSIVAGAVALVLTRGLSFQVGLVVAASNILELTLGFFLLVRIFRFRPELERVRDAFAFAITVFVITTIGATLSACALVGFHLVPHHSTAELWSMWWWTHLSGDLVVTPAILTVARRSHLPQHDQRLGAFECVALALSGFAVVLAILARWLPSLVPISTPPYYVLPMLLWAGIRFGPRGAAIASLSTNLVAIVAQAMGIGPFVELLDLQSFVTISSVGTLLVSALAVERMRALETSERSWRLAHERLEAEVASRTKELRFANDALVAANDALARRDESMRQAAALARFGTFEYEPDTDRLQWSEGLYAIFGRDPQTFEPTVETILEALEPSVRDAINVQLQRAIANAESFAHTARIRRPDASERVIQTIGRVFRDNQSRRTRLIGSCQDITERELAERAHARLAQLVESSNDAIIGLAPSGTIETWNSGAVEVFGYAVDEVVGRSGFMLVRSDAREQARQGLAAVLAGEHAAHYEAFHVRKNGETFPGSVTTSPVRDPDGVIVGLSKVVRDITREKQIEAQLRASLGEKEVLLREIHHRVKNNLQVIASLLKLEASVSKTTDDALVDSQNRIHSMALIHQLLYQSKDFSHIDFGNYLKQLTAHLAQVYDADKHGIAINVRCSLSLQLTIDQAIPCGLIINELVTNALTHAFPGGRVGTIDVELTSSGTDVTIVVADDGIGIAIDDPDRIGRMGLRIARTLASQLGGELTLERAVGTVVRTVFSLERARSASS